MCGCLMPAADRRAPTRTAARRLDAAGSGNRHGRPDERVLESVVVAGFDPNRGLFSATPDGHAYPNPLAGGAGGRARGQAGSGRHSLPVATCRRASAWPCTLRPPTPAAPAERLDGGLAALETMGLVLGRALYEGVLLDCPLAPFFVARLQARPARCVPAHVDGRRSSCSARPPAPPGACADARSRAHTCCCRAAGRYLMSCRRWIPKSTALWSS